MSEYDSEEDRVYKKKVIHLLNKKKFKEDPDSVSEDDKDEVVDNS